MSQTSSVITCRNVSFSYPDGTRAADDINLEIKAGELFCLLGPNGAGKTTLIRQLTCDLAPSSGVIEIFDLDVTKHQAAAKSRLGIIPQNVGLFDALSVREHLKYFGPMKGLTRAETKVAATRVIEECELSEYVDKRASQLSGGQQRKVLLALALLADPDILVLDEPTVGLDPSARRNVWATIERQRAQGKTILLTTHYLDEAEHLATRLGFIDKGVLGEQGTLQELYARLGKSIRLVEQDADTAESLHTHLFDNVAEAQKFAQSRALESYSIGRVSLEDIYLRLVGHNLNAQNGGVAE